MTNKWCLEFKIEIKIKKHKSRLYAFKIEIKKK